MTSLPASNLAAPTPPAPNPIPLSAILKTFFWIGFFSFGGGLSGWIHREVVQRHKWMTDDEVLAGIALAQVLPGANVTKLAVFVGNRLRGVPGAAVALSAMIGGPMVLCILVLLAYGTISSIPVLQGAVDGVAAAAVGLNLRIGIVGAVRVVRRIGPTIAMVATFVSVGIMHWPLVPVVLIIAPLSIASVWPRKTAHG
jgi:chromate transporter